MVVAFYSLLPPSACIDRPGSNNRLLLRFFHFFLAILWTLQLANVQHISFVILMLFSKK